MAIQLARSLVIKDVPAEEIVARLQKVPGGRATLRRAARAMRVSDSFSVRAREFLRAAAGDAPVPSISSEQRTIEDEQRQLLQLDLPGAFSLLAERVPALLELERRGQEGLTASDRSWTARLAARSDDPRAKAMAVLAPLVRESMRLVGPHSGQSDSLLASAVASSVVRRHLATVVGAMRTD